MAHYNLTMTVKRGMTGIPFEAQLFTDGVPLNLTGCTIQFRMKKSGAAGYKVDAAATPDPDQTIDGRRGWFKYFWNTTDVDTLGTYNAEAEVTIIGGAKIAYPTMDSQPFATVRVKDTL